MRKIRKHLISLVRLGKCNILIIIYKKINSSVLNAFNCKYKTLYGTDLERFPPTVAAITAMRVGNI